MMKPSRELECVAELRKERANCNFNIEELTNIIDGGVEKTASRRSFEKQFLEDPEYVDKIPPEYLSHEERVSNELRKSCYTIMKASKEGKNASSIMDNYVIRRILKDGNPLMLHWGMFIPGIKGQGTPEQKKKWVPLATSGRIIGTYAQTEMGHGTFLRGLETTATYSPDTQEFILHTPCISATKWWPGGMGKTANYALVMAQLYTKGQCHGPHLFMVQIRDEETHHSLKGITVGEIGPRMGMNTNDIGFLKFDNYRIPRSNMLMKNSQVLEDGTYVKPVHSKLNYGTMMYARTGIILDACKELQCAVTIATRYSAVRRQSELVPGEPEPQILDYQTQQYKLLPHIASVFALHFSANSVVDTYMKALSNISKGSMDFLSELHFLTSGLKALSTTDAAQGADICRLACGGHGYIASSNLPRIYTSTVAAMTYEGENTVLWLQVARHLIKSYRTASENKPVFGSVAYLALQPTMPPTPPFSNRALVDAYKSSVMALIQDTDARLQKLYDAGQDQHHAWNNSSVQLVKCAQAHTRYYVCEQYVRSLEELEASEGVRNILSSLCRLYIVHYIILNQGDFLKSGAPSGENMSLLEGELCDLLALLRPQAVPLVDAFNMHDLLLNSTLGSWDGNVYQRLYDEAQKSPLNKTDVPKAYYKYLRPLLKSSL
ncbi:peroxisomal acyl-coenzyme A oxidase 1-like isoform X1 [Procambarus clarkii]|uniref:peroxisomal acyl-coenzyme A oxidase 1-like isoform X1 n=1 Tax=Procambarus clarkii TaxID=6728 RepID=UPI00374426CA